MHFIMTVMELTDAVEKSVSVSEDTLLQLLSTVLLHGLFDKVPFSTVLFTKSSIFPGYFAEVWNEVFRLVLA